MKTLIPAESVYTGDYDWHTGRFHFSFADYVDEGNDRFGVLKALNDFDVKPGSGFETHPHEEMEIISYCVEGELTHADSMGNKHSIKRGDVQYLCAGSGITHSEMNGSSNRSLRFIQIWILPNKNGMVPKYLSEKHSKITQKNILHQVVSGEAIDGVIQIAQDANIYVAQLEKSQQLKLTSHHGRQCYLLCLEGNLAGSGFELRSRDAMKYWGADQFVLTALEDSHILMIEMAAENSA
jgi:redox-sensitive bicupin YhaK (pirin superfamily)